MKTEIKIWEDRIFPELRDNLVIHFEIPVWQNETDQTIEIKIFWKKNLVDVYIPGKLVLHQRNFIEYEFANGIRIKGKLEIKKFSDPAGIDTHGIFSDFYYYKLSGQNYIWHTEGFLIGFSQHTIVIETEETEVVAETIIRKPITPVIETDPIISTSDYTDLFPYIYVSGWPKITRYDKTWNFFSYETYVSSPPLNTFYTKLTQLKLSGNREQIQNEAVNFIEGNTPYDSIYVNDPDHLKGHISNFLLLYSELCLFDDQVDIVAFVCVFFAVNTTDFLTYLSSEHYLSSRERLWESYFALTIENGYAIDNSQDIITVLKTCNFLEKVFGHLNENKKSTTLDQEVIDLLLNATILLPSTVFPLPPYMSSPPVTPPVPLLPYAIGDLQLVKYKLLRYQVGEVASVLSIMPGERRKSVNRKLDKKVDYELSKTVSETDDTTAVQEQNNDFNEELWNAIAETTETTNYPDPGLISSYGPPTDITIKGSFTKAVTSQNPDKKQTSSFAKKILTKTTQRLSEKVNKVRSKTEWKESENTSVSLIDNQNGKDPIYAVHCWLNKIYDAKVVRYGNRMLLNFIVPNPGESFIRQTRTLNGINLTEPKTLKDFNITCYTDVQPDNYLGLCQYYGIKNFPLPPVDPKIISDIIHLTEGKLIALPPGYYADSANLDYAFGSNLGTTSVNGFIGQQTFSLNNQTVVGSKSFASLNKEQETIPVGVVSSPNIQMSPPNSETDFQLAVEITCKPSDETVLTWQIEIYQLAEKASTEQSTVYHDLVNNSIHDREQLNPQGERLIVKQELEKAICTQLLEYALKMNGLSLNLLNSTSSPTMQFNQPEIIQYLRSSMEWDELSYTFFDEYDDQKGVFSVSSVSSDFFSAFLQSKYARVLVPVNPYFNQGTLYFLATGIISNLKDSLTPCIDPEIADPIISQQISIVNELKKLFTPPITSPEIVDQWEVLIPTSMQILQNKQSLNIKNHA